MIKPDERTQVTRPNYSNQQIFLHDLLRPLWIFLRNNGIHHGFLPPDHHHRIRRIIRCIFTLLIVLLILTFNIFHLTQLAIQTANRKTIADISLHVEVTSVSLMGVFFLYLFYIRHEHLAKFFEDWKQFESSIPSNRITDRITIVHRIFVGIFTLLFISCIYLIYVNLTDPNKPIFFSSFDIFQEIFGLQFLAVIYAVSTYFIYLFYFSSEIIPTLFFYQASFVIEKLGQELENICLSFDTHHFVHSRNENNYPLIWKRYESIQRLVDRANELFGITMILNQFLYFCFACLYIHQAIVLPRKELLDSFDFLLIADALFCVARNVVCHRLLSRLYVSWGELKRNLAAFLSEKWYLLPQNHRDYLTTFLIRLNDGGLAANPLNLLILLIPPVCLAC